jgi:hypothetical protein
MRPPTKTKQEKDKMQKWAITVRYAGSPWQHELVIEAYGPREAENIARAQFTGITLLGYAHPYYGK